MNEVTRTFYSDPGHGWLKVSYDELSQLGIQMAISSYSYREGNDVFLEEDCDFGRYIRAMNERGIDVKLREVNVNGDSVIRMYPRYYFTMKAARAAA